MKIKKALTGTVATCLALGVIASLGEDDTAGQEADTGELTDTISVTDTIDQSEQDGIYITLEHDEDTEAVTEKQTERVMTSVPETEKQTEPAETVPPETMPPETEPVVTEAPKPVTEAVTEAPKPIVTAAPETEAPEAELTLISMTTPIAPSSDATLILQGKPNTNYFLVVTYKNESKADGLGKATSDSTGKVSWTWKVGQNTDPGEKDIEVYIGDSKRGELGFEMKFTVTE